jgi:DNA-directed RNA polymerase specialized sigma24 family protein
MVPLDAPEVESHLASDGGEDAAFDREWARGIVGLALARLEAECAASDRRVRYEVFLRYDVDPDEADRPTYAAIAAALGIPATQVTNHLHWARREFRRLVLEALREVTGGEAEFRDEARLLLGAEVA